jgi:probable rRNA maturation factor
MGQITVQYAADKKMAPQKALLCKWALEALSFKRDTRDVTIRIVETGEMTQLNTTYRKKRGPTNVLSFPADLPEELAREFPVLGDIVICAEVVNREADEQHKQQQSHWAHMVVHGVLHLLGHDHEKDDEAEKMEQLEIEVLSKLGFPNPYADGERIKHHE